MDKAKESSFETWKKNVKYKYIQIHFYDADFMIADCYSTMQIFQILQDIWILTRCSNKLLTYCNKTENIIFHKPKHYI